MGAIGIIPFLIGAAFSIWRMFYRLFRSNRVSVNFVNAVISILFVLIVILALGLVAAQSAKLLSVSEASDLAPLFVVMIAFSIAALPGIILEALVATYRMVTRYRAKT